MACVAAMCSAVHSIELTVYDVVQAVDPLKRINSCPLQLSAHTERLCSLHQRLDDAVAMVESYFKQTTIASLLNDQTATRTGPLCELPAFLGIAQGTLPCRAPEATESLARKRSTSLDCRNGRGAPVVCLDRQEQDSRELEAGDVTG